MPTIATNKKALFNYQILEKMEAGIVLSGQEVKSIKGGNVNLKGSYVTLKGSQAWLINAHVSPYKMASTLKDYQPTHDRKLLLKKHEIASLIGKSQTKGLTILPISVYTKGSLIKISLGVCRGKKQKDKREIIKKRESDRHIRRLLKQQF